MRLIAALLIALCTLLSLLFFMEIETQRGARAASATRA